MLAMHVLQEKEKFKKKKSNFKMVTKKGKKQMVSVGNNPTLIGSSEKDRDSTPAPTHRELWASSQDSKTLG